MNLPTPREFTVASHPQRKLMYQHITHEVVLANGVVPHPQYKLNLFGREGLVTVYTASSTILNEMLKTANTAPQLDANPKHKILAVHMVHHPIGWPKRQKPRFHLLKSSPAILKETAASVPVVAELPYLSCPTPSWIILDPGVFKFRDVFPYAALGGIRTKSQWVVISVKPSKYRERFTRIAVLMASRALAGKLLNALTSHKIKVLTVNEQVRTILLFSQQSEVATVLGAENLGTMNNYLNDLRQVNERWVASVDWNRLDLPK